jgi:DDE superfamily endonuclease
MTLDGRLRGLATEQADLVAHRSLPPAGQPAAWRPPRPERPGSRSGLGSVCLSKISAAHVTRCPTNQTGDGSGGDRSCHRGRCALWLRVGGLSAPFRQGLTARKLAWAVGIPRHLKVYPADVRMIWPVAKRGRPRQRHVPDILSIAAEDMLANAKWRTISWRTGTKGKLKARFTAVRVRVADGPPQRIRDKGQQHLPGDEAWLIGEHRMSGEKKYYLANLPAKTALRTLAATIKARWICEQAHQQMKEELGLDHFEGRSWQGLHRHALMTMIAAVLRWPGFSCDADWRASFFQSREQSIIKKSRRCPRPDLIRR